MTEPVWDVGDIVAGTYEVRAVLGRGGMGVVHRVTHLGWHTDLAVKSLLPGRVTDAGRAAFVREAETWVSLGLHPHVCECHYVRVIDGQPRVFVEYLDGGSVLDRITDRSLYRGSHTDVVARILDIAVQVAQGLAHAHERGTVHQDVKPANILLGAGGTAKITDFGLARAQHLDDTGPAVAPGATIAVTTGGLTPAYASPEQFARRRLGRRSDVWSLAVSVLEMLLGELAWFTGPSAAEALTGAHPAGGAPGVPAGLAAVLAQCLRTAASERPSSAQLADSLRAEYRRTTGRPYPRPVPRAAELLAGELNNRALSFVDLGDEPAARELFDRARATDPDHLQVVYNQDLLRWRAAEIPDGVVVRDVERLASVDPDGSRELLARVHRERGEAERLRSEDYEADFDAGKYLRWIGQVGARRLLFATDDSKAVWVWLLTERRWLTTLAGSAEYETAIAASPDGRTVVIARRDGTVVAHDLQRGRSRLLPTPGGGTVSSLAVSPDGKKVVGTLGERVQEWRLRSGLPWRRAVIETYRHTPTPLGHVRFGSSPVTYAGGNRLIAVALTDVVHVHDLATRRPVAEFTGHTNTVSALRATADGKRLVSSAYDGTLRVWNLATGACERVLSFDGDELSDFDLSPGDRFVVAVQAGLVRIFDFGTGRSAHTTSDDFHAVAGFTDDDWTLVVAGSGGRVRVQRRVAPVAAEFELARSRGHAELSALDGEVARLVDAAESALDGERYPEALALLENARAIAGHRATPRVLAAWRRMARHSVRTGVEMLRPVQILRGHRGDVEAIAVSPDASRLVSAGIYGTILSWPLPGGEPREAIETDADGHTLLEFTPDGQELLANPDVGRIVAMRFPAGQPVREFERLDQRVECCAVSRDGATVAWATRRGMIAVAGRRDAKVRWRVEGAYAIGVTDLAMTPDGRHLVACGWSTEPQPPGARHWTSTRVWDLRTGEPVREIATHGWFPAKLRLTPDGTRVVVAEESRLGVWRLADGTHLGSIPVTTPDEHPNALDITPDSRFAVYTTHSGHLHVADLDRFTTIHTASSETGHVTALRITPDGRFAAVANQLVITLWEIDWILSARPATDWDEAARPYLDPLRANGKLTKSDLDRAVRRLQWAGFGHLRRRGVARGLRG